MRNIEQAQGEFYHVYNRGTDRRDIFGDTDDVQRFFQSMREFNVVTPIGSIYENRFRKQTRATLGHRMSKLEAMNIVNSTGEEKLVEFIAYALNPNHFHFLLEQVAERGIEKFMQRLGNGYTKYFNGKNKRTGVLFQGKYKSIHTASDEYFLRLSAYINLNDRVHNIPQLGHRMSKTSWGEYLARGGESLGGTGLCKKGVVLEQFNSIDDYKEFAEESLSLILSNRADMKAVEHED